MVQVDLSADRKYLHKAERFSLFAYILIDEEIGSCSTGRGQEKYPSAYAIPHQPLVSLYRRSCRCWWGWKAFQRAREQVEQVPAAGAEGYELTWGWQ